MEDEIRFLIAYEHREYAFKPYTRITSATKEQQSAVHFFFAVIEVSHCL